MVVAKSPDSNSAVLPTEGHYLYSTLPGNLPYVNHNLLTVLSGLTWLEVYMANF
jgi:hypothetical protein